MNGTERAIAAMTREAQPVLSDALEERIYTDGYKDAMQNVRMMLVEVERHWDKPEATAFAVHMRKKISEDLQELG